MRMHSAYTDEHTSSSMSQLKILTVPLEEWRFLPYRGSKTILFVLGTTF